MVKNNYVVYFVQHRKQLDQDFCLLFSSIPVREHFNKKKGSLGKET